MNSNPGSQYRVRVERDVPMTARDGVTLRADVYRPDADGRFPVLLARLPYNKANRTRPGDIDFFVERGYVVIYQDCRGRFASEGEPYYPVIWDADDGYDAVEWAAALPYSDGRVGTFGQSYLGLTQYQLAPTRPPHLRACFPVSSPGDFYHNFVYHSGGALELGWRIPNILFMARNTIERIGREDLLPVLEQELSDAEVPFAQKLSDQAYRRLPLAFWSELLAPVAPYLADYLDHPEDGPYWWQTNVTRKHSEVTTPMYHVTSWYDLFLPGTLAQYTGLRANAATAAARDAQFLLIGPWAHIFPYTAPTSGGTGDIDFGPNALIDLHEIQLQWFDHWLKNRDDLPLFEQPRIKLFVMGTNVWRDEHEWPLARTRYTKYFLHSDGRANSLSGDGLLTPTEPVDDPKPEPPDRYVYDPADPVPTCGGNTLMISSGVQDQRQLEGREDVLVYTSAPLDQALEITGPISITLFASSDATDTDFTAKLVDVRPDGYAHNLVDGMIRARYRNSTAAAQLMIPGQVVEFTIDLWATSHVLFAGHRLRVEISSSNFPRFDRNLNLGTNQSTESHFRTAQQTIFHDATRPSHILLPVIPT